MSSMDTSPRPRRFRWLIIAGLIVTVTGGAMALILPAVENLRE